MAQPSNTIQRLRAVVAASLGAWASSVAAGQVGLDPGIQILPQRAELTIRELVEFEGATTAELVGVGLVTGLPGTGDTAGETAVTRPIVEALRSQGVSVADPEELGQSRAAALVWLSATVPASGGRVGDRFDLTVSAALDAQSLAGGTLLIAPLRGHLPGDAVVAFGRGNLKIDNEQAGTIARIPGGAQLVADISTFRLGATFNLKVRRQYEGFAATTLVASTLNESYYNSDEPGLPPIAEALDHRTVRVRVPEPDQDAIPEFVTFLLKRRVRDTDLLNLPARVIVNRRTGAIVATADVDISPVGVSHERLQLTITQPPPVPTPENPLLSTERWAQLDPGARPADRARLSDLLAALRALDMPVQDQIDLLAMMHRTGALHAELIEEQ
ncbi:MAG: flagellar basal body P-ring protein FlgI [Planctomycetota bacterium]